MANIEHLLLGDGAPSAAPPAVGAHYVDTDAKATYIAIGTDTVDDWGLPIVTGTGGGVLVLDAVASFEFAGQAIVKVDLEQISGEALLLVRDQRSFDLLLTGATTAPDGRRLAIRGRQTLIHNTWVPEASALVTTSVADNDARLVVGQGEALYRAVLSGGTLSLYLLGEWPY